jgi:hypothetical protein
MLQGTTQRSLSALLQSRGLHGVHVSRTQTAEAHQKWHKYHAWKQVKPSDENEGKNVFLTLGRRKCTRLRVEAIPGGVDRRPPKIDQGFVKVQFGDEGLP